MGDDRFQEANSADRFPAMNSKGGRSRCDPQETFTLSALQRQVSEFSSHSSRLTTDKTSASTISSVPNQFGRQSLALPTAAQGVVHLRTYRDLVQFVLGHLKTGNESALRKLSSERSGCTQTSSMDTRKTPPPGLGHSILSPSDRPSSAPPTGASIEIVPPFMLMSFG